MCKIIKTGICKNDNDNDIDIDNDKDNNNANDIKNRIFKFYKNFNLNNSNNIKFIIPVNIASITHNEEDIKALNRIRKNCLSIMAKKLPVSRALYFDSFIMRRRLTPSI